jgi:hypothetical protein
MSERQVPEFAKEANMSEEARAFHGHHVQYKELPRQMYMQIMNLYFMNPFGPRFEEAEVNLKKSFEQLREVEPQVLKHHVEQIIARCTTVLRQERPPSNLAPELIETMVYMFNTFIEFQTHASPEQHFKKFDTWSSVKELMEVE